MKPIELLKYACTHHKEVLDFVQERCPRVLSDSVSTISITAAFLGLSKRLNELSNYNSIVTGFVLAMLYSELHGVEVVDCQYSLFKEMTELGKYLEEICMAGNARMQGLNPS